MTFQLHFSNRFLARFLLINTCIPKDIQASSVDLNQTLHIDTGDQVLVVCFQNVLLFFN